MPDRTRVNVFLALWLAVILIDAFRPVNDAHAWLEETIDPVLDVTGLWQGPWRLFGPDVDKDNKRLSAKIIFTDHVEATWESPDWTQMSPLRKFVRARHLNYFSNIMRAGQEPAWDGLAAYLARTVPHPPGGDAPVEGVVLFLRGALIPDPSTGKTVPAAPFVDFDEPQVIHIWRATP